MNTITITSYSACKTVLRNPAALIPAVPEEGLTPQDRAIKQQLVRLSNPPHHAGIRQATEDLFWNRGPVNLPGLLEPLLYAGARFDWVENVTRRLPALFILKSFAVNEEESNRIVSILPQLVLLMKGISPGKEWVAIYPLLEGPLIGLLIQSYDATRGLLTNALFHLLQQKKLSLARDETFCKQFVLEVLRYDSPVLHTRRTAGEYLLLDGQHIQKGDLLLLMLATANHDPQQFAEPGSFDIHRHNNDTALSFGYGMHACIASAYCINLTVKVLNHLATRYPYTQLEEDDLQYETLPNVRLIKNLLITLR